MNILHYKCGQPPTCTCFGHLLWLTQGGVIQRRKEPILPAQTYFFNFRMVIQYTIVNGTLITHLNLAQIILYVFYILIYVLSCICTLVFGAFVIYIGITFFSGWPQKVAETCICRKLTMFIM